MVYILSIGALPVLGFVLYRTLFRPKLHRQWEQFHKELPEVVVDANGVAMIKNIRHARYTEEFKYDLAYSSDIFNITHVKRVWFAIEPYARFQAHTFLSFEFTDGRFLSLSVEVRKTNAEDFWGWQVLVWNYEIFYVLADEQDVLYLRTNIRKDHVHLYPLTLTPNESQAVFRSVLESVNTYAHKPFWYRLLKRNCTIQPMRHLRVAAKSLPWWHIRYVLTEYADWVLYKYRLIDTHDTFENIRKQYYVTDKAQKLPCDANFSQAIRAEQL